MSPRSSGPASFCRFRTVRGLALLALAAATGLWAQDSAPATARGRVQAPVAIRTVVPEHPPELRQKLAMGDVVLECVVGVDGRVGDIKVISESHPGFAAAAEDAVRQWEFKPGLVDGQVAPVRIRLPFEFRLSGEEMLSIVARRQLYEEVKETVIPASQLPAWPRPLEFYTPRYPPELEGSGKYGKAVVNITINKEGQVINPRIVKSTYREFDLPALLTAIKLQFPPQVMANNERIYVNMDIQFDFKVPPKGARTGGSRKK